MTFWFEDPSILVKKDKITSLWPSTKQNIKRPTNTNRMPTTRSAVTPRRGGGRFGGRG